MPKYFARGWLEIMWDEKRVGLEEVEGLTARLLNSKDSGGFYRMCWLSFKIMYLWRVPEKVMFIGWSKRENGVYLSIQLQPALLNSRVA